MKALFLLTSMLTFSLIACTSHETLDTEQFKDGTVNTGYLTVNITETGNLATRGAFDEMESAILSESEVRNARFYFFDADGNSVSIKNDNGSFNNYIDWEFSQDNGSTDSVNEEALKIEGNLARDKRLTAHFKIISPSGDKNPEYIIAVLNYHDINSSAPSNLKNLKSITGNFDVYEDNSLFVMSNSVYANTETDKIFDAVDIKEHVFTSEEEAENHPVTIYVERVNAKVRLQVGEELSNKIGNIILQDGTILYNIDVENDAVPPGEEISNKVYVKFLGWNVTCEPTKSYLIKNIDPEWNSFQIFGTEDYDWSSPINKRSHWAINPNLIFDTKNHSDYRYVNFSDIIKVKGFGIDDQVNYTYIQENAAETKDKQTAHPSQVVVAAQIVNSKGEPWEITQWGGAYYLKEDILTTLANMADIYDISSETTVQQTEDGSMKEVVSTVYRKLNEQFFKFVSASEAGMIKNDSGRFLAYLQLDKEAVKDMKLAREVNGNEIGVEELNLVLAQELPPAKIWKDGYTYFYFDIEHLQSYWDGNTITTLGVVRNHIYDATIVSLTRLGTPVFNENEVIIPESPEDDESYIYARINIINWRLASKLIQLEW